MIDWAARAQAHFSETGQPPTAKTDGTPLLSVSSVPPPHVSGNDPVVSSVSSVGVAGIFENCIPAETLIAAAMRACDYWNDSEEAREQMRLQCLETPPHLRAELLKYFRRTYPRGQR